MSSQVFKEIDTARLSPAVMLGSDAMLGPLKKYVRANAENPLILEKVGVAEARELAENLQLEAHLNDYIVVVSSGVSKDAWTVLLKSLEDFHPNTRLWFVGSDVPRAVRTRCFSCYVPSPAKDKDWNTKDEFLAASWLVALDERSRERLLKSQEGWTVTHNRILLHKIDEILDPTTGRELELIHTPDSILSSVLSAVGNNVDKPTAAFAVGMKLLTQ